MVGDRSHVLGRGRDADVVVDDAKVSRRHILLTPDHDGWLVRDTSANGVWRDGRRLAATVQVSSEPVRLRLGATDGPTVVLSIVRAPEASPSADRSASMADAETRLAGSGSAARKPPGHEAGKKPHDGAAVPRAPAVSATAPQAGPPDDGAAGVGAAPGADAPSGAARWARLVPTLLWLAATGFAIGALIALS